jgi:altronate dehydratase
LVPIAEVIRSRGVEKPKIVRRIKNGSTEPYSLLQHGAKPAPSIKLATNSPMYARLSEDMDINCGEILDGTADIEAMGQRIFELMLAIASGEESKSESLGLGDNEFVPWQIGITG